jgi:hypothetical protein
MERTKSFELAPAFFQPNAVLFHHIHQISFPHLPAAFPSVF